MLRKCSGASTARAAGPSFWAETIGGAARLPPAQLLLLQRRSRAAGPSSRWDEAARTLSTTSSSKAPAVAAVTAEQTEEAEAHHDGPSSSRAEASSTNSRSKNRDDEPIYPSSQAALRPNPYARAPLYRHIRARPGPSSGSAAPSNALEPPPIARLNEALRMAVSQGRDDTIVNILDKFEELNLDTGKKRKSTFLSVSSVEADSSTTKSAADPVGINPLPASDPLLSTYSTRHWSPVTYHHVLQYCASTSRVEFALAVFGSAFHRAGRDLKQLRDIFPASAISLLLRVILSTHEARLAYELSVWLSSAQVMTVPTTQWQAILEKCAKEQYLPGLIGSWKRIMRDSSDLIDEGLVLQILSTAARHGDADFCLEVLRRALSATPQNANTPRIVLNEGLLAPLFEAFCAKGDLEAAIRLLSRMQAAGMEVKRHAAMPLSKAVSLTLTRGQGEGTAHVAVQEVTTALRNVASVFVEPNASNQLAGAHVSAYNAVIIGAIWGKRVDVANDIYKLRKELLGIENGATRPLTLDEYLTQSLQPMDGEEQQGPSSPTFIAKRLKQSRLLPDLDTFHALISACADTKEIRLARKLLQDLNGFNLEPTAETYQRLVKLCLACAPRVYENKLAEAARESAVAKASVAAYSDRPFGAQTMVSSGEETSSPSITSSSTPEGGEAATTSPSSSSPATTSPSRSGGSEPTYEDAFKLLEECKKRNLKPTQATYEALIWRCWREHDPRWHEVYEDMRTDAGYVGSWNLLNALEPGFKVLRARERAEAERMDVERRRFEPGGSGGGGGGAGFQRGRDVRTRFGPGAAAGGRAGRKSAGGPGDESRGDRSERDASGGESRDVNRRGGASSKDGRQAEFRRKWSFDEE
ncbi:hypothetical protein V8E36_000432 [Tilletia maclaganii]